jgi:glycosyltransferase involved in cell wall biosynthesis
MDKKYKVAVIAACPFPYLRGTPIRIFRMAEALAVCGHEVHVITYHLGQKIEDLPFAIHRISNVPTYHKLSPGPTYQKLMVVDSLLAVKIGSILSKGGFDLIHAHHYEGLLAALPAARLLKIPVVFDVHTLLSTELPHYPMGISNYMLNRIGGVFDHWLPRRADHIVSVTNLIRDRLINEVGIEARKVTTVYGGIEADHFTHPTPPGPESTSQTLIYTGNLAPYQGVDLMFQAFRKVLDAKPDVKLKIITDSSIQPYANKIAELGLQHSLIIENADYFQLPAQLHSASIALNPRVHCDGLPLKLLNYMATGRAIVSFAGSAEALEHEHTGLVVPNNDITAFASAILRFLGQPLYARALGESARSYVQEFFVWENSVKLMENIYDSVLKKYPLK